MARNEEVEVYGIPEVHKNRYYHPYTCRVKTTQNVGDINPIYNYLLVQPGDTISMSLRSFFKMTTSLFPSMDVLCADIFCFAQDWQNDWEHTKEFWGEDEATPFEELVEYTVPQFIIAPTDAIEQDDILNRLAVPVMEAGKGAVSSVTRTENIEIERLSYNTYIDIYNRYFRDQNYIPKIEIDKSDADINYADVVNKKLLKAARLHDYFAGTPEQMRGDPPTLPLGTEADIRYKLASTYTNQEVFGKNWSYENHNGFGSWQYRNTESNIANMPNITFGIYTDLTSAVASTVNALRLTAATTQIQEELMWFGSRFEEIIYGQWGVRGNAGTFRIAEYLGGSRIWLNMDTVLQTSETTATSPLGDSAGYSVTYDEQFLFTKSFTTWQNIMIVCVIRQDHSYAQGIANQHSKKRKYDFYWDKFQGLGAQPRYIKEIAVTGTSADNDTWNFAPAWREYTSEVDRATGLMQPGIANTLANYTYTDEYTTIPDSGKDWIEETSDYVDRTLVVDSSVTPQFRCDFVFEIKKTSIVPNYRLPGLDKL